MTASSPLRSIAACHINEIDDLLAKVSNLVNPNSGIANDFLNQYNEILLLVENLPVLLPEMTEELLAWKPKNYEDYFQASPLPGGEIAIRIYQNLDRIFRSKFESQIAKINKLAAEAIAVIEEQHCGNDGLYPEKIDVFCRAMSKKLRVEIEKAVVIVNHGLGVPPETTQAMADRLMGITLFRD